MGPVASVARAAEVSGAGETWRRGVSFLDPSFLRIPLLPPPPLGLLVMAQQPPPGGPYVDPNQQYQPQQPYAQPDPYAQQAPPGAAGYPGQPGQPVPPTPPTSAPPTSAPPPSAAGASYGGRGKRRGYAEQQYEFGTGGNVGAGAGAPTPGMPPAAPYPGTPVGYPGAQMGGYPQEQMQQPQYGQPMAQYGQPMAQPGYMPPGASGVGAGNIAAAAGGYDPSGAGVTGMTDQFSQMGMGGPPMGSPMMQQQQPGGIQKAQPLNQLFTVDLMQQPFNVAELDFPPPEIILPPNVRTTSCVSWVSEWSCANLGSRHR